MTKNNLKYNSNTIPILSYVGIVVIVPLDVDVAAHRPALIHRNPRKRALLKRVGRASQLQKHTKTCQERHKKCPKRHKKVSKKTQKSVQKDEKMSKKTYASKRNGALSKDDFLDSRRRVSVARHKSGNLQISHVLAA